MIDLARPRPPSFETRSSTAAASRIPGGPATDELREIAYDLVGRPERDEVTTEERMRLAVEVEEAVAEALMGRSGPGGADLPSVTERLAAQLSPRVEALPIHLRVALANARRRQLLGVD